MKITKSNYHTYHTAFTPSSQNFVAHLLHLTMSLLLLLRASRILPHIPPLQRLQPQVIHFQLPLLSIQLRSMQSHSKIFYFFIHRSVCFRCLSYSAPAASTSSYSVRGHLLGLNKIDTRIRTFSYKNVKERMLKKVLSNSTWHRAPPPNSFSNFWMQKIFQIK